MKRVLNFMRNPKLAHILVSVRIPLKDRTKVGPDQIRHSSAILVRIKSGKVKSGKVASDTGLGVGDTKTVMNERKGWKEFVQAEN